MIKLYRSLLAAVGFALVMTGCASGPQYKDMAGSIPTLGADHGRIYFLRSSSLVGAGLQPEIKLNGQVVGKSQPGGFFFIDKPAGQYTVTTATETEKSVSFALEAGETKYVRTSISLGLVVGRIVPSLETPENALKEIEELKYTGGADPKQAAK